VTHPHGHYLRYRAGCKCAECRAAWNAYIRDYMHRRGFLSRAEYDAARKAAAEANHGTEGTYRRFKCDACRRAATDARRRRRAANREADAAYNRSYRRRKRDAA
jgi:hypothetical protein